MSFLKALGATFTVIIAVVMLFSLGSAFYAAFLQGGLLWNATPFQLLIEFLPYLFGLAILLLAPFFIIKHLYSK